MAATRRLSFRRIATIAVAGSLAAVMSCAPALLTPPPEPTSAGIRFVFVDSQARSVALAGTFNQWSVSSHPLRREARAGIWSVTVALPVGEHHFVFVVDGARWATPPAAEDYVDDGFGMKNGVVVVKPLEP